MNPKTSSTAALPPDLEARLALVAERFPDDLEVARHPAQGLRQGPPNPPQPAQEPWPPMRVPE
jgi:hypothetical protein